MRLFRLQGIEFRLNRYFLAVVLLFALSGQLAKILTVFFAVLLHELAHVAAAVQFGFQVRQIELLPFGGVAQIERLKDASAKQEFILAAAGPAMSLLLAVFTQGLRFYETGPHELLQFFFWTNLMLLGFNLLPALPLDGGRMTRALLSLLFPYNKATRLTVALTYMVGLGLVSWTVYDWVSRGNINVTSAFAALFLFLAVKREARAAAFRSMRVLAYKKADLQRTGYMQVRHFLVMEHMSVLEILHLFQPDAYAFLHVMQDNWTVKITLGENEFYDKLQAKGAAGTLRQLLSP